MNNRVFVIVMAWMTAVPTGARAWVKEEWKVIADDWNAETTCIVHYYNVCTGWSWVWHDFQEERIGVIAEGCCSSGPSVLERTVLYVPWESPPGYGFTGTIAVHAVNSSGCPTGAALAVRPYLPGQWPGPAFDIHSWNGLVVPSPFALVVQNVNPWYGSVSGFATDHPAAGPTGGQPMGACYPAERVTRSFIFGAEGEPFCPSVPFHDGVGNAELMWNFEFAPCPTHVEATSWGKLKALYK